MTRRRLLSVGHSYVVALNRRLAHEMARAGSDKWDVTAAAPEFLHGDLRPIYLEPIEGEACALERVNAYASRKIHWMFYGRRLRSLLAQPWDFVHCWEEPYILSGAQIARWIPEGVPWAFWTAQNLAKKYPPPFSWMERYCVRRCTGWMAGGHTVEQTLLARGYDSKPRRILALGVDTDVFSPAPSRKRVELGWGDDGPPVVGYLGRFVADKGVQLFMDALNEIVTPWRALLVGGGPMEGDVRKWSERYPERVKIVTGVIHDKVPEYLNAMDILCAPSQTMTHWREQFGRMLVEAFACGVPVIGSDSGEIPYVIADAGVVAGEKDQGAWVRAISELLESPARRRDLAERGRARAVANYAWPIIARRHLEFFEELIESRSSR